MSKLKLKIKSLNVIKDIEQNKIVGGKATGVGPVTDCTFSRKDVCSVFYSTYHCTATESSGCPACP